MNRDLRDAIQSTGRKQYFLAREAGISDVRLSRIVHGHVTPTAEERAALARLLERPVDSLFRAPAGSAA